MNHCIPRDFVFRSLLDNVEMRANGHMEVQLRLLLPLEQMWYVLTLNIRYYVVKLICIPIYIKSFIFSGGRRAVDNKMQKALCVTWHVTYLWWHVIADKYMKKYIWLGILVVLLYPDISNFTFWNVKILKCKFFFDQFSPWIRQFQEKKKFTLRNVKFFAF